jgi:hypothetical protein
VTPAERHLLHARQCIEEMPDDPGLATALFHVDQALGEVRRFEARHAKTDPSDLGPPSSRRELETLPDGAE